METVPSIQEINKRIDELVAAIKVAPDRSDLKLRLSLYLALKRKVE